MSTEQGAARDSSAEREASVGEEAPLVSVVIPSFNRARLIPDAIDSVLDQTYENWELIVVDDGSTDETEEVVRSYADPRIRYTVNTGPSGPGGARNVGVRCTQGPLIAFLDSDDIWLPEKLQLQVQAVVGRPELGLVGGGCRYVDENLEPTGKQSLPPGKVSYEQMCISVTFPGATSNAVVRRSAFEDVGGFDSSLLRSQDRDLFIKLSRDWEVECIDRVTVGTRVHEEERPDKDLETILECRTIINQRIPEPDLRRKANAWMWYQIGRRLLLGLLTENKRFRGLAYLVRSFVLHPRPIGPAHERVRPLIWRLRDEL